MEERFEERIGLAAQYVGAHLQDMGARQLDHARRQLSGEVTAERFDDATLSFGFEASVLLDAQGVVLAVSPQKPSLVGTSLAGDYEHLANAVAGRPAVSDVVLSAAEQKPIVAVATPYDGPAGRRVISGGYQIAKTPLAAFLAATSSLRGRELYLVDRNDQIVASTEATTTADLRTHAPALVAATAAGRTLDHHDEPHWAVARPVAGTTWRLVASVPSAELLAPVSNAIGSWLVLVVAGLLALAVLLLLNHYYGQRNRLDELSRTDALTGLANRGQAEELINRAAATSVRTQRPWAMAIIDVDHFKVINDRLGHQAGDRVLRHLAAVLKQATRTSDAVARWGGEEFVLIMEDADTIAAAVAADRIAAAVRENVTIDGVPVTVSIGVAARTGAPMETLLSDADAALYRAKAEGRDRVEMALPTNIADMLRDSACPQTVD